MKTLIIAFAWVASLAAAFFLGDYYGFRDTVIEPTEHGRFLSNPVVKLHGERDIELIEDLVFVDPNEKPWLAPKGTIANGASIPKPLWSWIGGPFTGKYRNASIVHDAECVSMKNAWSDVHLMFYHACLAGGVPDSEAKRLYWAVARFGPRWNFETRTRVVTSSGPNGVMQAREEREIVSVPFSVPEPTDEELNWAKQFFDSNDPPLHVVPELGPETVTNPE